jgi:hypothetical protein
MVLWFLCGFTSTMTPSPPGSALATVDSTVFALQVRSVDDLARLARVLAASGYFGSSGNQDTQIAQCAVRLMAGMEAGFSAVALATGVHIIEGKPAFSSNLMAQAVRRHPAYDYQVLESTDKRCRIQFTANGKPLGVSEWNMAMAERAGLATKSNWKRFPEAQLFARSMSAGVRTYCPDALGGAVAYVPEELGVDDAEPVAVTVTEVVQPQPQPQEPAPSLAELRAHATIACRTAGLSLPGLEAFCFELTGGDGVTLAAVSPDLLARIISNGISSETVARCNAAGEAMTVAVDDEPPATWQTTEPTATS